MAHGNVRRHHVFVVLRIDGFHATGISSEEAVTVTKVFWTLDEAEAEVQRLNQLNGPKGSLYFWRVGRLRGLPADPGGSTMPSQAQPPETEVDGLERKSRGAYDRKPFIEEPDDGKP